MSYVNYCIIKIQMHPYWLFYYKNLREFNNVVVFDKEETGFSKNTNTMGSLEENMS